MAPGASQPPAYLAAMSSPSVSLAPQRLTSFNYLLARQRRFLRYRSYDRVSFQQMATCPYMGGLFLRQYLALDTAQRHQETKQINESALNGCQARSILLDSVPWCI